MAKLVLLGETDSPHIYPLGEEITKEELCRIFNEDKQKVCYVFHNFDIIRALVYEIGSFKPEIAGNYTVTFGDKSDTSFSYGSVLQLMKDMAKQRVENAAGPSKPPLGKKEERPPTFGSRLDEEGEKVDKTGIKLQLMVHYKNVASGIEHNCLESTRESISLEDLKGKRVYYDSVILTATNRFPYEVPVLIKAMKEYKPSYYHLCLENFTSIEVSRIVLHLKPKKIMLALKNGHEKLGSEIFEIVTKNLGLVITKDNDYAQFLEYLEFHSNITLDFGPDENLWTNWTSRILKDFCQFEGNLKLRNQLELTTRNTQIKFDLGNPILDSENCVNITELFQSLSYDFSLDGLTLYLICKEKKPAERILLAHKFEGKKQTITIRGANFWLKFLTAVMEELKIPREERNDMLEVLGNTRKLCDIYDKLYNDDDK